MKPYSFAFVFFSFGVCGTAVCAEDLATSLLHYRKKISLETPAGQADIYNSLKASTEIKGLRNVRAVLPGIVYRGGADNRFTPGPNPNRNPLPVVGQENLCRLGFSAAFYLYSTNYSPSRAVQFCTSERKPNSFRYNQESASWRVSSVKQILKTVHTAITQQDHRPIYLHCWNGWHASGYISALILRQFCAVSGEDAVQYWNRTAAYPENYQKVPDRIRQFVPEADLSITAVQRALVCPRL